MSEEILTEYKEVLSRSKFKLTSQIRLEWFEILDNLTTLIEVNVEIDFPQDRKDAKFLACAVAAEADFLVTGDSDFNLAQSLVKTAIVSVSLFNFFAPSSRTITVLRERAGIALAGSDDCVFDQFFP